MPANHLLGYEKEMIQILNDAYMTKSDSPTLLLMRIIS